MALNNDTINLYRSISKHDDDDDDDDDEMKYNKLE